MMMMCGGWVIIITPFIPGMRMWGWETVCTVLRCAVLYCTVLYCTVLYCTVLYGIVLCWTVLYCTVLCFQPSPTKNILHVGKKRNVEVGLLVLIKTHKSTIVKTRACRVDHTVK